MRYTWSAYVVMISVIGGGLALTYWTGGLVLLMFSAALVGFGMFHLHRDGIIRWW